MKTKLSIIIASHLSDAQECMSICTPGFAKKGNHHINFAKFLLFKYRDTTVIIDPELEYKEFCTKHPNS